MDEKIKEVLDQYSFQVSNLWRGRGAFICDTNEGLRMLREYALSPQRLVFESLVKYTLCDRGYMNVDQIIPSGEGALFVTNKYDRNFVVKTWFEGREGDTKSREDIQALAANLGRLHKVMADVPLSPEMAASYTYGETKTIFERHIRELRTIRNYMKAQKQKTSFELLYLSHYDEFYNQALAAAAALKESAYDTLMARAMQERTLCHGDYNHHNIFILHPSAKGEAEGFPSMATVNFDKMHINIQVNDLYLFLRKIMEKNQWNLELAMDIVQTYDHVHPMSPDEKECLYILMLFPEKFWKIANHYYNTRKSWSSGRDLEKLQAVIDARLQRQTFLKHFKERLLV